MSSRGTSMLPVAGENFALPGADSLPFPNPHTASP